MSILENVDSESLVIMDELGSGTDPTEGMGIAIAALEELNKSGATFLVTTHYPEVKNYSNGKSNIINARMDFDKENLAPLYRLIIGEAGESCAFAIAKKMGMSDRMLEVAAKAAYGDGSVERREKNNGVIRDTIDIKEETSYNNKVNKTKSKIIKNKERKILDKDNGMKYNIGDSVMIYPDKKIASVKHKSVMKRFNEARFAAGANRDYMQSIEFAKLSLDDLIDVALEEMGAISDTLGL